MNIKVVLCLCLVSVLIVGSVSAGNFTDLIEYTEYVSYANTPSTTSSTGVLNPLNMIYIPSIENWKYLQTLEIIEIGNNRFNPNTNISSTFIIKISGVEKGSGVFQYSTSSDGKHDRLSYSFSSINFVGLTGDKFAEITYNKPNSAPTPEGTYSNVVPTVPSLWWLTSGPAVGIAGAIHQSTTLANYKGIFTVNTTGIANGTVDISHALYERSVGGTTYPGTIDIRTQDNSFIFINQSYKSSGNDDAYIDRYPSIATVKFGYPYTVFQKVYTITGENPADIIIGTPEPTPTPTISGPNSGCGMNIELSLSKYANIFPYENITASLSIDDTSNLTSGSKITYAIDTFNLNSPLVIATFSNISGTWHAHKNDLGIISDYDTTLSDALSENIRFSDAGYYTVSAYVDTPTGCYVYDTVSANVNPTSQVNVDFYFRDAVSGELVGFVDATIANVGITGNVSYYGNPIGIAASRYDNISIYCDHEGYETKFFYYTVPQPPYGNVLDVPVYLTPLEAPIIYADNTVLSVNVKSAERGEPLSNADVSAYILGVECDSGWTDGNGFVSLIVPFHSGYTLLSTGRFPYNSDSRYLSLNNATSYSVDVYLSYAGTPIVTPTPSYNYTPTLTPTTTDTPMPTSTVISTPLLYVHVWDADEGMSYPISSAIVTIYDGDEVDQTYKGAIMYTAYTDTAGNIEPLQITSNSAFWCSISKTGYYTQIERYRMTTGTESHIYVPLKRVGGNVTIATTQPTLVLPTPGGTGIQGGFIGWILDYFAEWFGVDAGTARILLALFIIMCSSVFVGGSLAGSGSGAGAGMGALIGGMFAFIAMCYVQFLPFWLLPIGIAFVGMAFFVWNRQEK